eukprot:1192711-Prymnesium_polylepis.1
MYHRVSWDLSNGHTTVSATALVGPDQLRYHSITAVGGAGGHRANRGQGLGVLVHRTPFSANVRAMSNEGLGAT